MRERESTNEKERERERIQEKWLIPDIYVGGKVGVVTGLEIATITLESQKRPTDQKINPPVDPMEPNHENRPNPWSAQSTFDLFLFYSDIPLKPVSYTENADCRRLGVSSSRLAVRLLARLQL